MAVQTGLCRTWSETPKTGFLMTRLICIVAAFAYISFVEFSITQNTIYVWRKTKKQLTVSERCKGDKVMDKIVI